MSLGTISCIFKACDSLRIMSLMLMYFNFFLIFRSKYLSDDWMEDKGFLEKERKEDNNKFWYRIYIYIVVNQFYSTFNVYCPSFT